MFSVQNLPSLLKHAIISSFVYIIAKPTLTPNISLPFILSIAIAQFMDLQEKCEIIHGQFLRQQCSFGTILYYTRRIIISLEKELWNLRQPIKTIKCEY